MYFKTNRGLFKFICFTVLTLGIYPIVIYSSISTDINLLASRYDGRKTMHFCLLLFLVSWLTLGIGVFVWWHRISERIGNELIRRKLYASFGASSYWGWNIFGILLFGIGPLVYTYKLLHAMNDICYDENKNRLNKKIIK